MSGVGSKSRFFRSLYIVRRIATVLQTSDETSVPTSTDNIDGVPQPRSPLHEVAWGPDRIVVGSNDPGVAGTDARATAYVGVGTGIHLFVPSPPMCASASYRVSVESGRLRGVAENLGQLGRCVALTLVRGISRALPHELLAHRAWRTPSGLTVVSSWCEETRVPDPFPHENR
jgi:hypothetical protein